MRRLKVILAAVAALMMMAVLSAPAMAQGYYWDPSWLGNTASTPNYGPTYYDNDPDDNYYNNGPMYNNDPMYYDDDCDWDGC